MLISIFNIPLIHLKVSDWENKKTKLLELMHSQSEDFENDMHLYTTFHNVKDKVNTKEYKELNCDIHQILNEEISQMMNIFQINLCKISTSWFQIQEKYMAHPVHNHHPGFAAVCYLEYDENVHTPVEFIAPYTDLFDGSMIKHTPENVTEGSILFFPASLLHQTMPNMSDKKRVALAFNIVDAETK
jgi:hypothetical protein